VLERELPKGGLRAFLVNHVDLFDVLETRDSKGYTFVVRHRPGPSTAAASSGLGDGHLESGAQEQRMSPDQYAGVGALEVVAEVTGAATNICSQESCTRPSQTQCPWCCRHFCGLHEETCKQDSERCWALWRAGL